MPALDVEFWVPGPVEKVWEFYRYPKNLEKVSPAHLGVRIVGEPETRNGELVEIALKPAWLPFALHWISRIEEVQGEGPRRQFVDVMERGLFRSWKHVHRLESGDHEFQSSSGQQIKSHEAGTWVVDHVDYELPFGPLNSLANQLLVKRALGSMFSERKKFLQRLF